MKKTSKNNNKDSYSDGYADAYGNQYRSDCKKLKREKPEEDLQYDGNIADNYADYLAKNICIGFTDKFPIDTVFKSIEIYGMCRNYRVPVTVQMAMLSFGEGKYKVEGVVTSCVDIAKHLSLNGFGSHCYADEAECMELAVVEACKQWDLMIVDKVCSWPFAKALVQKNHFKN